MSQNTANKAKRGSVIATCSTEGCVHEMEDRDDNDVRIEEIIKAFERELDAARHLNQEHADTTRDSWRRDMQIVIERRRKPR
jgi:hypothetical protein